VRRRNLITKEEMPYPRPLEALGEEIHYDSGDYAALLDRVLAAADWDNLQAALMARRQQGELVGAGIAMFVEKSGLGPSDGVKISVDTSGMVEVITGGASIGQGFETVMAQVCAETLGVDYRAVRVIHGQTDRIAFGIGAHASRATVMTASATYNAAMKLRAKALDYAAGMMQAPVGALAIVDGEVVRTDRDARPSMSLGAVALGLEPTSKTRGGREPGLSAEGWFDVDHQVYPYGTHVAVVRVDRETGGVTIERYVIGYDIGRAINPVLVEGQIVGGFAQGLGGALYEEFLYNERGDPLSTSFADYLMPSARETPRVEVILTEEAPSPLNPLGIKGAGESGITPVGAVIAAAVEAAIGMPGAIKQLPITPQRLKHILDGRR
jgi:carbon-monoxide dehydrogenase large subunit/6-hydroxypseudooxynicotine dehydrogenase subunit gamma